MRKPEPLPPLFDDQGQNVFSERETTHDAALAEPFPADPAERQNIYAAGTAKAFDSATTDRPQYETVLASRGALMVWLTLVCGFVFGMGIASCFFARSGPFSNPFVMWMFILPLGVSLPMMFVAWFDLRAMRHGAMDASARRITQTTMTMGVVVSLVGLTVLGYCVWQYVRMMILM